MKSNQGRNTSVHSYFQALAARHQPRYRFSGSTRQDWERWRASLLPAVKASLGRMPQRVPINSAVEAEWRADRLIKQRVILDVEDGLSLAALVFRPEAPAGRRPAILACHGHGPFGKDAVMGLRSSTELSAHISALNYDYGLQMARAGFVTIAIDWRGFGERDDRNKPHHAGGMIGGRDLCNLHYLRATILGMTVLGMNIHDAQCALEYLCQQPDVDPQRLGVMGLSFGGTMTTWLALCDDRLKAANVICYSDRFADFGMRDTNFCGSQITPGLYGLCDVSDLHGLIAPKPLLVEIGAQDSCFLVGSALSCFREVEKIYAAAGCGDRLELDLFEGGHRWGGNKSVAFFKKHLE
ncbi:MAG TPA: alpha/beta hydrolase family protein [Tepidisphaeraceae bacterium]|jgi:dienelactone hydrolase|nr:alpha/beta hydrolase family protein [Tepidisphaeraceae bacterium]